ncbi:hypothetical protein [Paraburkholderia terricola]|uniref:hypothetical protein n=1 Tax=Paraburkholderia terricola TaxID=169427 RepID=UPI003ED11C4B
MKMAKASSKDLDAALDVAGVIENVCGSGYYPSTPDSDADDPTFFDPDDREHLRAFYDRVTSIVEPAPGSLFRVVGGLHTILHNNIVDPDQDVIELHPRFIAALEAVEKLAQIRASIMAYNTKEHDDPGPHDATHATEIELVDDLLVRLDHMESLAVSAGGDAERAIERARLAESRLESATQPLDEQMARLNQRVIELNAENERFRTMLPFQTRVRPWMMDCFGAEISADMSERCHRLFEESGEACQSKGMTRSEAHQLVDYTWDRPIGEPSQEVGGVMVTLAAFCLAAGIDMHAAGETELARISVPETVAKIRAKQAAKPKYSPLPEAAPATAAPYQWADTGPLEVGDLP